MIPLVNIDTEVDREFVTGVFYVSKNGVVGGLFVWKAANGVVELAAAIEGNLDHAYSRVPQVHPHAIVEQVAIGDKIGLIIASLLFARFKEPQAEILDHVHCQ